MNWDQVVGNWKQMSGALAEKWGKLSGDELAVAHGNRNIVVGRLQEHYGLVKEEAETQLDEFVGRYKGPSPEVAVEGAPVDSETLKIGM